MEICITIKQNIKTSGEKMQFNQSAKDELKICRFLDMLVRQEKKNKPQIIAQKALQKAEATTSKASSLLDNFESLIKSETRLSS